MQPRWRPEEIRSKELNLTVVAVTTEEIHLRLDGKAVLDRTKGYFKYGYDASFRGRMTIDRKKETFTRFDVLAVGDWTWNYERKGPPKDILGVALELLPRPFASPEYDLHFPGYSMSNYGYRQDREK